MRIELQNLKFEINNILGAFDEIQIQSKFSLDEDPRAPLSNIALNRFKSIHYNTEKPGLSEDKLLDYEDNLHDLKLRKLPITGTIKECQERHETIILYRNTIIKNYFRRLIT